MKHVSLWYTTDTRSINLVDYGVTQAVLESHRRGSPSTLTVTLKSDKISFNDGDFSGNVVLRVGNVEIFHGFLFRHEQTRDTVTLTFYDILIYLKNFNFRHVYVQNQTVGDFVRNAAQSAGISVWSTSASKGTQYAKLEPQIFTTSALDAIEKCIDQTLVLSGQYLQLYADGWGVRLENTADRYLTEPIDNYSALENVSLSTSIEDSSNVIVLDRQGDGVIDRSVYRDSDSERRWGSLVYYEKIDDQLSPQVVHRYGEMLLALKNRPKREIVMDYVNGDILCQAGLGIYITGSGWWVIDSATHTITPTGHSMSLKLWSDS